MKKATIALTTLICVSAAVFFTTNNWSGKTSSDDEFKFNASTLKAIYGGEEEEEKGIKGAKQYMNLIRQNQDLGYVPVDAVVNAREQVSSMFSGNAANKNSALGLDWEEMGPDNIGGRVRAILIDRNDPQRMYTGGVSGGLFYSDNGGLQWNIHPWTLEQQNVGVTCLVQDPNGDILIGTGEAYPVTLNGTPVSNGAPGFIGSGVHRLSADGTTYSKLPGTEPSGTINSHTELWSFINDLAVSPTNANNIYVSTERGFRMSTDGGVSFIVPQGIPSTLENTASVEVEVGPNGNVYAMIGRFYYRSADGVTFSDYSGEGGFPGTGNVDFNSLARVEFAVTEDEPNFVYALLASNARLTSILKSEDGGISWTTMIRGSVGFNPLGEQSFWNVALGVVRGNPNRVFIGGQLELWSLEDGGNRDMIAYWQPESYTNPYYVHADMHVVVAHPTDTNVLYIGCDGGVFRTNNASAQFPEFKARNKGLNITQLYGMGTGFNGAIIAGAQDNGTNLNDGQNNTDMSYREVNGGDGGAGEISRINPNAMFATVYSGACRRSSNYGSSFGGFFDTNIDSNGDGLPDNGTLFLSPFVLWEQEGDTTIYRERTRVIENSTDPNNVTYTPVTVYDTMTLNNDKSIFVLATNTGVWFTPDALNFSITPRWYKIATAGTTSEVTMSESGTLFHGTTTSSVWRTPGLGERYYLDSNSAEIIRTVDDNDTNIVYIDTVMNYVMEPNFGTSSTIPSSVLPRTQIASGSDFGNSRFVTGIAVDANDESTVVVSLGNYGNTNYVYRTTDADLGASTTWEAIDASLPEMPVYDVVIDYYNSNNIILGTEFGIWACNNGTGPGNTITWEAENSNTMTTCPVFKLRQDPMYDMECRILYAATHGRGVFRTTSLTPSGCDTQPFREIVSVEETKAVLAPIAPLSNMNVYPNPISDVAFVEFDLAENNSKVDIKVIDLMGRIVKEIPVNNTVSGSNKIQIDLSEVSKGVYVMAAVMPGNKALTKKVIVQ